jgi:hypothetical protein
MVTFDGDGPESRRLWHTYFHLARSAVLPFLPEAPPDCEPAIADDPSNRLPEDTALALQAIVLAAFVLEYRLKRVLTCLGIPPRENASLRSLVDGFWGRVGRIDRLHGAGKCRRPPDWDLVERKLVELVDLRNQIAHADYPQLLAWCRDESIVRRASVLYLAVVDAVRLINIHTGSETRSPADVERYFLPLRVKRSQAMDEGKIDGEVQQTGSTRTPHDLAACERGR